MDDFMNLLSVSCRKRALTACDPSLILFSAQALRDAGWLGGDGAEVRIDAHGRFGIG
jgi:hypothetical protein